MAEFNLSIAGLFPRAFGVQRGKPYDPPAAEVAPVAPVYEQPVVGDGEGTEFVSVRNALNATLPDGRPIFMPTQVGDVLLPNEPTISFSRRKKIVKTTMTGSELEGEVKELISLGDWEILIRGIAINHASTKFYPEDEVKKLRELEGERRALPIQCALTSLLGIYSIVIEEIRFPDMPGIQHAQAYELKCVSDRDFILEID